MAEPDGALLNTIVVVGEGSARVNPDTAVLNVGLETRADTAGEALSQVTERSAAVLAAAKAQGTADDDLQTLGLSLFPQMDHQARRVVGYVATYSVALRLRDVANAAAVVDAVSQAAGDCLRLGGFHLSTTATGAARAEAGARAVEDARRRAEHLAEAAGVRVGRVTAITEARAVTTVPGPRMHRMVAASSPAGAAVPIEAGSEQLSAQVTVRFEIAD